MRPYSRRESFIGRLADLGDGVGETQEVRLCAGKHGPQIANKRRDLLTVEIERIDVANDVAKAAVAVERVAGGVANQRGAQIGDGGGGLPQKLLVPVRARRRNLIHFGDDQIEFQLLEFFGNAGAQRQIDRHHSSAPCSIASRKYGLQRSAITKSTLISPPTSSTRATASK